MWNLELHFYYSQETGNPLKLCNFQRTEGKDYVQRNKLMLWSILFCNPLQTLWCKVISIYYTHEFCGYSIKRMILFCSMASGASAGKTQSWGWTWWLQLDSFEGIFLHMSATWAGAIAWSTYMVFPCGWLGFFTMALLWDSGAFYMVCWCSKQDRSRMAVYEIASES